MNSDLLRLLEKLYGVRLHLSICPLLWLLESVNDEGSNWIFWHTQESMLK